jgi:hypothetical protein
MTFRMRTIACEDVRDSKGRILPTVMAEHISADEALEIQVAGDLNDERLLVAMQDKPVRLGVTADWGACAEAPHLFLQASPRVWPPL